MEKLTDPFSFILWWIIIMSRLCVQSSLNLSLILIRILHFINILYNARSGLVTFALPESEKQIQDVVIEIWARNRSSCLFFKKNHFLREHPLGDVLDSVVQEYSSHLCHTCKWKAVSSFSCFHIIIYSLHEQSHGSGSFATWPGSLLCRNS